MRGFSLQQYYLYAVTDLDKRIENRTWKPPKHIVGKRIALHASKAIMPGSLNAVASLGHISTNSLMAIDIPRGVIVATAVVEGHATESRNRWFFGPYGWILSRVHKLDNPIPCKGMLGLWRVPRDIEWEIRYQLIRDSRFLDDEADYD
jgi:hypothetical protein